MGKTTELLKKVYEIGGGKLEMPKPPRNLSTNYLKNLYNSVIKTWKNRTKMKEGTQAYNQELEKISNQAQTVIDDIAKKLPPKKPPFLKSKGKLAGKIGGGAAAVELTSAGLTGKGPIAETIKQTKKLPFFKKDGGMVIAPKMGGKPSYKAKKSSKSIAKKYFKGTF
jgi:hypothetical protein